MATNLKLGDRLAIIRDGVNKGQTPEESIKQYKINKDGGYNAWKNQFKQTTGLDPDQDDRYDYEAFFKENPEAAKQLLTGQVSPEILQMYKTSKAVQQEQLIQKQQQRGSINDLMDYSQYEKLINNYMNQSASNPSYAYGGRINIYAEGTDDLDTEDTNTLTSAADYNSEWVSNNFPSYIDVTPEELNEFKRYLIEEDPFRSNDLSVPEEYRNLPRTMFVSMPHNFIKKVTPYELKGYDPERSTTYYIQELIDDLIDDTKNIRENQGKESKNKKYRLQKLRQSTPEGIAYEYWKTQQELLKQQEEQGSTTLPEYVVYPGKYEPKSLQPLRIGERKPIEPYADYLISHNDDPFKSPNGSTPTEVANRQRIFLPNIPEYQFGYSSMQPYPLEPWNLQYLQPQGIVPIPNWDIEQVRDNYRKDNSAFLAFMANLMNGIRSGNNTDELMLQLMQPKDYFADPYAGSHYTDTQSFYDAYDNNPYNKIQRESNGTPLYKNGGKINK